MPTTIETVIAAGMFNAARYNSGCSRRKAVA
jgi:hypothetical protein